MNNNKIDYVSACAGSGKTSQLLETISKKAKLGFKFVIAQPTQELVQKTVEHANQNGLLDGINYAEITTRTNPNKVRSKITELLQTKDMQVLFVTHASVLQGHTFAKQSDWHLIVDEIPSVDVQFTPHLSTNANVITDHIEFVKDEKNDCYLVKPRLGSNDLIAKWAENEDEDKIADITRPLWTMLRSNCHRVFVSTHTAEQVEFTKTKKFEAHAILLPTIFERWKTTTIMGANFENSLLHIICDVAPVK